MNKSLKAFICKIVYSPVGDKVATFLGGERFHAESFVRSEKKKLLAEAKRKFDKGSSPGSFDDYKQALDKHWVAYSEYAYQYEFYKKSEEERNEYVSRLKMAYFYLRYGPGVLRPLFRDKARFLKNFNKYVHRQWLYAPEASFEDFQQLVSTHDCIVKPLDGSRGKGVFKIYKDDPKSDGREFYEFCVKDKVLLEQCIESCEELSALHPQSLNTVRVVTFSNKEKACVFSGVLRAGVGDSVIDNSHAGGVSAQINIQTGVVESDGVDVHGNRFECHPNSGIRIRGFKIPQWDKIVETCCKVAMQVGNPITGWDVVINIRGEVEFIEGNHTPDFDVMQMRYKVGLKKRIYALIKEYCGVDMA